MQFIVKHYFVKYVQYGPMNVILTLMLHVLRGTPQYVQQDDREHTQDSGGRLAGRGCCDMLQVHPSTIRRCFCHEIVQVQRGASTRCLLPCAPRCRARKRAVLYAPLPLSRNALSDFMIISHNLITARHLSFL